MKTITNERLNLFVICSKHYLNNSPKSKLWFAVDKLLKTAIKMLKKVQAKQLEKKREHAVKLDKGIFDVYENGTLKYNVDGEKKLAEDLEAIDQETIDFPTHIIPEGQYDDDPKVLSFDIRNAFEGIVIPEIDYDSFDINSFVAPEKPKPI